MSKVIVLGDCHGRSFWKLILNTQEWDKAIFIGDYFDTHEDIPGIVQLNNFEQICKFVKEEDREVILLIGNHDFHYFPEIGNNGTSGYQAGISKTFEFAINENRDWLQMAYSHENILFTHAGVGENWIRKASHKGKSTPCPEPHTAEGVANWVNDVFAYQPRLFNFDGTYDHTGDDLGQTPIWIRPRSLMIDSRELKKAGIIQIVGHTQQNQIDIHGKATGGKYFFIDTLGTSGEYLIIEDGVFKTGSV